jgi:phosphoglycolate phosphatase
LKDTPLGGSRICGLVFDKDGTLFDFRRTWNRWCADFVHDLAAGDATAARSLAMAFHYDLERRQFAPTSPVIAGTMDVVVAAIQATFPGLSEQLIRERVIRATSEVEQVETVPLRPLMEDLLARGLTLGIATNDAEAAARAHLEASGILRKFAFISGYDSGNGAKPGPGMLQAFCDRTGIAPECCAMIGDSLHDLASGRAAGMRTIGVLTGLATAEDLGEMADVVLPDIGALPRWIVAQTDP